VCFVSSVVLKSLTTPSPETLKARQTNAPQVDISVNLSIIHQAPTKPNHLKLKRETISFVNSLTFSFLMVFLRFLNSKVYICFMYRVLNIIKNKYVLISLAFITWMLFFDRNDISSQYHYQSQLKELQQEKEFYTQEIKKIQSDLDDLTSDPKKLQKFAREKYFMKKENEDVYVIIQE
jgi:cell division protein FtsB